MADRFRVGAKVRHHIYDNSLPRDAEHFFGEVAVCHRATDATLIVDALNRALKQPVVTWEQTMDLWRFTQAASAGDFFTRLNQIGIEVAR